MGKGHVKSAELPPGKPCTVSKGKIASFIESPWWKLINSALFVGVITVSLSTCHNIGQLSVDVENSNQQLVTLETKVLNAVSQVNESTISNENKVEIVNQTITKVEKEIGDIKQALHQHYGLVEKETFRKTDEDIRIKLIPIPTDPGVALLFFKLAQIPEANSVTITTDRGANIPFSVQQVDRNIVRVLRSGSPKLFRKPNAFYEVSYIPDFFNTMALLSLEGMVMNQGTDDRYEFRFKEMKGAQEGVGTVAR